MQLFPVGKYIFVFEKHLTFSKVTELIYYKFIGIG